MKSSSDGAMAERAKARFDAHLQQLPGSEGGGPAPTPEARAPPLDDAGSSRQRQQRGNGVASFPAPAEASAADQATASHAAPKMQPGTAPRAPGSRTGTTAKTPSGRPPRKRLSIPRVSQMFIQAVQCTQSPQTPEDQISGITTPTPTINPWMKSGATNSTTVDGVSSPTAVGPSSTDAGYPGVVEEGSSVCGGKNSTAEFGKRYAVLRVKVKRSYRKRRMEVRRQLDEKLWKREVPHVPKVQARSVDVEEVPRKAQSPPMIGSLEVVPWTNAEEAMAFRSIKVESPVVNVLPEPEYEESCINAFWCLWILGFLFPPLWLAGATGVLTNSQSGFIAGMTNVVTLLVAGITIAIFTV
ncbi:unnamed protein product [Ostreobium quekettii]|uniref:Uncharacterized protein n=1 Tax=Ostreobium quekettii TaxID=121088 RepID=A0A8S1J9F5_9CHLO|nr:unnamed protein product [Ostreobium quekettii]